MTGLVCHRDKLSSFRLLQRTKSQSSVSAKRHEALAEAKRQCTRSVEDSRSEARRSNGVVGDLGSGLCINSHHFSIEWNLLAMTKFS